MPDQLFLKRNERDDYIVLLGDRMVGAIFKVYRAIPKPWRWRIDSSFADDSTGWAESYEAAKAEFRQAWELRDTIPIHAIPDSDP